MHRPKEYGRRLPLLLLFLVLGLQICPVEVGAENAKQESAAPVDPVAVVEPQIRAFADTIDQGNANTNAAMDLAVHGMFGNGSRLTMDATSPMAATLLNSEVVQEGFAVIFGDVIQTMQRLDLRTVPGVRMSFEWYGTDNSYGGYILTDAKEYPDNLDWMVTKEQYAGSLNSYDNSLEWMVGNCEATAAITCIEDAGSEKTYRVTATFGDRFDFSTANTSGFKKLFSGIGMLMFREFDWDCTVTVDITAPYAYDHCGHSSGAYHWIYDDENRAMISDGSGIYLQNNTTHRSETANDGTVHHYYELDNTVRLYHDKPWVLEYDVHAPVRVVFAPIDNAVTKTHPQIVHSSRISVFAVSKDYAMAENSKGELDRYYAYNYFGTMLPELYKFTYDKTYTFRLENEVAGDGNNRIYLTVAETETGELCLDRIPMDDYYYYGGWMKETAFVSEESSWLSGKDIHINYIGTGIAGFNAESFDLRIWETGRDASQDSHWIEERHSATCTEAGYTARVCGLCGVSERVDTVPALGHSYGAWEIRVPPAEGVPGEEIRECITCGETETRPVDPIIHTHSYSAAVTDPTCTEEGYTTYTCRCGDSYVSGHVEAIGHHWRAWEIVKPATQIQTGEEQRECPVCRVTETRAIPMLPAVTFTDVSENAWFTDAVYWAVAEGITNGTSADTFSPDMVCDRAQVVTFLWRAAGAPKPGGENPFTDVKEGEWYTDAVLWAVAEGITNGTSADTFSPDMVCDRAQVVTFLWRTAGTPEPEGENPFTDVKENEWYTDAVLWAVEQEITNGTGAGEFSPLMKCSRSQIVTFLYRAKG